MRSPRRPMHSRGRQSVREVSLLSAVRGVEPGAVRHSGVWASRVDGRISEPTTGAPWRGSTPPWRRRTGTPHSRRCGLNSTPGRPGPTMSGTAGGRSPGASWTAPACLSVTERVCQTVEAEGHADLHELHRRLHSRDRARLQEIWKLVLLPGCTRDHVPLPRPEKIGPESGSPYVRCSAEKPPHLHQSSPPDTPSRVQMSSDFPAKCQREGKPGLSLQDAPPLSRWTRPGKRPLRDLQPQPQIL